MRELLAILMAGAVLGAGSAAIAAPKANHTVSWYGSHPTERNAVLKECNDDRSLDPSPDCKNATAAAAAAGFKGTTAGQGDAFAQNEDPNYYRKDPMSRDLILSACTTNRPPPASWCKAAQEAKSNP